LTRCSLLGHRFRFTSEGVTLRWVCARGCGAGGDKSYPTAQEAARYARAFDREGRQQLGRNAPLVGLFPLRILHALRGRRRGS
jgi:hypothetical protein